LVTENLQVNKVSVSCLQVRNGIYQAVLEYYDENGKRHVETFEGTECTVICHELDHFDGVLHMDKAIKLMQMAAPERKIWRESHPYTIIRKDDPFISEKQKILTKGE